jgi:hypothetical protein
MDQHRVHRPATVIDQRIPDYSTTPVSGATTSNFAVPRTIPVFTLLAPNDVPGLSIRTQNGKWIDAPAIPGAFVVNGGQLLQRWTNDYYHRDPRLAQFGEDKFYRLRGLSGGRRRGASSVTEPASSAPIAKPGSMSAGSSMARNPLTSRWCSGRSSSQRIGRSASGVPALA